MSLLIFLLLALLLLSLIAGLLRRVPLLAGLVVALGLGWLAWGLWRAPLEGNIVIWGRTLVQHRPNQLLAFSFQLTPTLRAPTLLLLFWGAIFALTAALVKTERSFYPAIPILLAALILFLSSAPLLWAPLWLMLAAVIMAFIAQGNKPRSARAALRTLLAPIIAFPFFLFAAWVFSQSAVAADDPRLWNNAWKALIIGMLILTSPVPLHGWITALGESSPAFAGAFLVGVWQIAIYSFLRRLLFAYPAFYHNRILNHRYQDSFAVRYRSPSDSPVYQEFLTRTLPDNSDPGKYRRLHYRSYFDNLAWLDGVPAMTAELTVRLKKAVPVGQKVLLRLHSSSGVSPSGNHRARNNPSYRGHLRRACLFFPIDGNGE